MMAPPFGMMPPRPMEDDYVDKFCRFMNAAVEQTVFGPVRQYLQLRPAQPQGGFWETIKSPPELPGLSRPLGLVLQASVPSLLFWYLYYLFSVCARAAPAVASKRAPVPRAECCTRALTRACEPRFAG
jgi:hypothetical protein